MSADRASDRRAMAETVWRQIFDLFMRTKGPREEVLRRLELSPNDAKTLCQLDPSVAKPMRALADACCYDASNATWVVDRLEERGFVERRSVSDDRRVKLVGLTPRGAKARAIVLEAMHTPPLPILALDRDDLSTLHKVLSKIPLPAEPLPEPAIDPAPVPRNARPSRRLPTRASRR